MVDNAALLAVMDRGPVLPVVVVETPEEAVSLTRAFLAGGIDTIEITLRTKRALDCVRAVLDSVPEMHTGAGTVVDPDQLDEAERLGAAFAVSPGTAPRLLDAAADHDLPLLPGTANASDVMALMERGWQAMKFFPAEPAGGAAYLKALASPLPQATFCPTGGITAASAPNYLALSNVRCVGGSWLAPADAIAEAAWERVTTLARATQALAGN